MKFNSIFRIRRSWPKMKNSWIDILYFAKPFYVDFHSLFRYFSVSNCFLSPVLRIQQNTTTVRLKNSSIVKNPMSKLAVHVKKGLVRFLPYDRLLRLFLGDLRMSFAKYGYAIVWREILLRACTSQSSQLFVARRGSINFV